MSPTRFEDLGLSPETLKAIAECGYTTPTPIQEKAIPIILMARDIVGLAQTGTGKTAGFTLPMIEALSGGRARMRMPRSLVLEPTRELAAQVAVNFDTYGKYHKLTKALLVGGESMGEQTKLLDKGVDVLIATPGRLLDLFDRGAVLLNDIKILVIDEADRMLDMGFIPDIEKIVSKIPPIRQTLLFSATMPPEIKKLTQKFLSNPKEVSVAPPASPAETVRQSMIRCAGNRKRETLDSILRGEEVKNAFIFLNRKRDVDTLAQWLKKKGYSAAPLHGDMPQVRRTATLKEFREGAITLLVCSDVAARGLDIQGVSHVFNFDVPFSPEDYVHRIGRTGRAGMAGRAWMIATAEDDKLVEAIEYLIKKKISVEVAGTDDRSPPGEPAPDADRDSSRRSSRPPRQRDNRSERRPDSRPENRSRQSSEPRSEPRPERSRKPERSQDRPRHPEPPEDDGSGGTGFGDEVPAFFQHK